MATCSIVARTDKEKDGTIPVYLRLWQKDRRRRLSLGLRVKKAYWNDNSNEVRRTHPDHVRLNTFLSEKLQAAERARRRLELSGEDFDADDLKDAVERELTGKPVKEAPRVLAYFDTLVEGYAREGKHASAERYGQAVKKLRRFEASRSRVATDLKFGDIDGAYLRQFREWLSSEGGRDGDGLAGNTVAKHLKGVRTLYYTARREDVAPGDNPFEHLTITETRPHKTSLTRSELERFAAAELSEVEGKGQIRPAVARDMFCFSCYAQGIRRSDALLLVWSDVERGPGGEPRRLRYRMRKNDKPRNLALVGPAQAILKRYSERQGTYERIFPPMDGWALATEEAAFEGLNKMGDELNRALREAAAVAGITKHLTFHVARHTFARLADGAGWGLREIQSALAHSSATTTERYLQQVRGEDLDDQMENLF